MLTVRAIAKALDVDAGVLIRTPAVDSGPAHPLIEAFLQSEERLKLRPSDEELAFLRSLPDVVWSGAKPNPETVASMLVWRRLHSEEGRQ